MITQEMQHIAEKLPDCSHKEWSGVLGFINQTPYKTSPPPAQNFLTFIARKTLMQTSDPQRVLAVLPLTMRILACRSDSNIVKYNASDIAEGLDHRIDLVKKTIPEERSPFYKAVLKACHQIMDEPLTPNTATNLSFVLSQTAQFMTDETAEDTRNLFAKLDAAQGSSRSAMSHIWLQLSAKRETVADARYLSWKAKYPKTGLG